MSIETFFLAGNDGGPKAKCVAFVFNLAADHDKLPNGTRVSDILPKDNQVRTLEGVCPYSGCEVAGSLMCRGNVAFYADMQGDCGRLPDGVIDGSIC